MDFSETHIHFVTEDGQEQVGRPPEEGGQESREPDAHYLADREVATALDELSQRPILEAFELVGNVYGAEDVASNGVSLLWLPYDFLSWGQRAPLSETRVRTRHTTGFVLANLDSTTPVSRAGPIAPESTISRR